MGNTIVRKGFIDKREEFEATAVAITPGMLIERTAAGKVQAHSIAGGPVAPLVALEDYLQGKDTTDDYAVSAKILAWRPVPGEEVELIIDAASNSVAIGKFVESAGNGKVRRTITQSTDTSHEFESSLVGVALEAGVAGGRIAVEII